MNALQLQKHDPTTEIPPMLALRGDWIPPSDRLLSFAGPLERKTTQSRVSGMHSVTARQHICQGKVQVELSHRFVNSASGVSKALQICSAGRQSIVQFAREDLPTIVPCPSDYTLAGSRPYNGATQEQNEKPCLYATGKKTRENRMV